MGSDATTGAVGGGCSIPVWREVATVGENGAVHVAVCAKQVPDPAIEPRLDDDTATLVRDGGVVLDPGGACAVELSLRIVEAVGGEVTVVSMTPGPDLSAVRWALAMGATRAIVVTDDAAAGSDSLGTARVLAATVAWVSAHSRAPVDLVVAATHSADGSTGTVAAQVAELLGLPSVTNACHVDVTDGGLRAHRQTDDGYDEVVCPLPALVSVTAGAVAPRHPTFGAVVGVASKPMERLPLAALGVDPASVGQIAARQQVTGIGAVPRRRGVHRVVDDGAAHEPVLSLFQQLGLV